MKIKIFFLAACLIACIFCNAQPVKEHGQLKVVGTKLIDAK